MKTIQMNVYTPEMQKIVQIVEQFCTNKDLKEKQKLKAVIPLGKSILAHLKMEKKASKINEMQFVKQEIQLNKFGNELMEFVKQLAVKVPEMSATIEQFEAAKERNNLLLIDNVVDFLLKNLSDFSTDKSKNYEELLIEWDKLIHGAPKQRRRKRQNGADFLLILCFLAVLGMVFGFEKLCWLAFGLLAIFLGSLFGR